MMSKKLKIVFVILFVGFVSCKKSELPIYEQNAGLFFGTSSYSYSFMEDLSALTKIIKLPVNISGNAVDYDRTFNVGIPAKDTITTAEEDQYRIKNCIVPANEFTGYVELEIVKDSRLDDSVYNVRFEIKESDEFPNLRLNKNYMTVSFTSLVIKPANWYWIGLYFGKTYSSSWWKFIQEKTGRTSLPYFPTDPDRETWWMSVDEVKAYQALVKYELDLYNAGPKGPLLHDDGEQATQPVTM